MLRRRSLASIGGLVGLAPLLVAIKCIPYDPASVPPEPDAGAPTLDAGAMEPTDAGFTPAVPCPTAGEANFRISGRAYDIVCGCREAEGRTCTIPTGTTVVWTFAASEEHNITSSFGMSEDSLTGRFDFTFTRPGAHRYGCTIHPGDMNGYQIVVE